jgi:hypothetical protein
MSCYILVRLMPTPSPPGGFLDSRSLHHYTMSARTKFYTQSIEPKQIYQFLSPSKGHRWARSAIVTLDNGLAPHGPCQAPALRRSPPALRQAARAFRLASDKSAVGEGASLGASRKKGRGEISSVWKAGSAALS